jgi:uncharacterized protein
VPDRALIDAAKQFVRARSPVIAAHDWWHIDRVRRMALQIGHDEGADLFVVELAAVLHEVGDPKGDDEEGALRAWLIGADAEPAVIEEVTMIVAAVSYRGAGVTDWALPAAGRCVRDADRLDAIGAIGIARAFAYGGSNGREIYNPATTPMLHTTPEAYHGADGTTINHFAEKLLLLRDRMETRLGRELADRRHAVMVEFLDEFGREWSGEA